ncbi:MAG TPA: hypothetical protein V6C76_07465 [Drouetiella sp.]
MAAESNSSSRTKSEERAVMHKRVEQKEDGRTLIYYTFGDEEREKSQDGVEAK